MPSESAALLPMKWAIAGTAPWSAKSRAFEQVLARHLLRAGRTVAYVGPPHSPWPAWPAAERRARRAAWLADGSLGAWRSERLFSFVPRTLLPMAPRFPFRGEASWKGCERFTVPRAGDTLRDAGFARVDVLLLCSFEMPQLVRHFRPTLLAALLSEESRSPSRGVRRLEGELVRDADVAICPTDAGLRIAEREGANRAVRVDAADPRAAADALGAEFTLLA